MDTIDAVLLIEDGLATDEEELLSAWQILIDTGMCWKLQGFYGRTASFLIDAGFCRVAEENSEGEEE